MTANRRPKRAIRSRMAQTGEKYTQARRALLASDGSGGAGEDPGVTITWPEDSLGWFTDQAYNAILLADDEARMLSHARVDPEHLLLAAAREVDDQYVETAHLLFGVLNAKAGVVAAVRTRYGWHIPPGQFAQPRYPGAPGIYRPDPGHENVLIYAQPPYSRATGIFSPDARRIVAEDVLIIAERLGHRTLTTGHVLIAILERPDEHTSEIISSLPAIREITAVIDALPAEEDT